VPWIEISRSWREPGEQAKLIGGCCSQLRTSIRHFYGQKTGNFDDFGALKAPESPNSGRYTCLIPGNSLNSEQGISSKKQGFFASDLRFQGRFSHPVKGGFHGFSCGEAGQNFTSSPTFKFLCTYASFLQRYRRFSEPTTPKIQGSIQDSF